MTDDEILARAEEIKAVRRTEALAKGEALALRVERASAGNGDFTDAELRYSAHTRCACGAGMAYPLGVLPMGGAWDCSAILKGAANRSVPHQPPMPFSFWKVRGEGQPSAGGATTRPPEK